MRSVTAVQLSLMHGPSNKTSRSSFYLYHGSLVVAAGEDNVAIRRPTPLTMEKLMMLRPSGRMDRRQRTDCRLDGTGAGYAPVELIGMAR